MADDPEQGDEAPDSDAEAGLSPADDSETDAADPVEDDAPEPDADTDSADTDDADSETDPSAEESDASTVEELRADAGADDSIETADGTAGGSDDDSDSSDGSASGSGEDTESVGGDSTEETDEDSTGESGEETEREPPADEPAGEDESEAAASDDTDENEADTDADSDGAVDEGVDNEVDDADDEAADADDEVDDAADADDEVDDAADADDEAADAADADDEVDDAADADDEAADADDDAADADDEAADAADADDEVDDAADADDEAADADDEVDDADDEAADAADADDEDDALDNETEFADGEDEETDAPDEDEDAADDELTDEAGETPTGDSTDGDTEDLFASLDASADGPEDGDEDEADESSDAASSAAADESAAGTDGGTPASVDDVATGAVDSPGQLVDAGDTFEPDGPESDEEMPLADHIEEMIRRLAVVLGIGGVITLLLYPGADLVNSAFGLDLVSSTEVIDFLWNTHVPGAPELTDRRPRVYGPLELLLTELKVAALGGLIIGLPVFVYETYLFMRPGLYLRERRYYLAAVPTSLVLAFIGIAFAHFLVLPAIFAYFTSYTTGTAIVAFGLKETFNLILILMGYNAIIFQIPLFVMLAIMMNLVTRQWLEDRRLLFWGTFLGLAFLVSPDPTGMAPIIIGATMIGLFEGTLLALRWTASGSLIPTAEKLSARRPYAVALAALVAYLLSPLPVPTGYFDLLPPVVVETLAANDLTVYTPLFVAGILVGVFELVALLLRRFGRSERALRARLAVDDARRPVWLLAAVVGYLGSPDPVVLRWAAEVTLRPALAGGIAVVLVLGYEALRLLLASREDRGT